MRDFPILLDGTVPLCREEITRSGSLGNALTEELAVVWDRGAGAARIAPGTGTTPACARGAMSTTRTTSDRLGPVQARPAPYTVVGGPRWDRIRKYPFDVTFLVLARGDRLFRAELLRDLGSRGIGEVIWVRGGPCLADIEILAREFPDVRFLLVERTAATVSGSTSASPNRERPSSCASGATRACRHSDARSWAAWKAFRRPACSR